MAQSKKTGMKKTQATSVAAQQIRQLKEKLRDAKAELVQAKQDFKAEVASIENQGIEKGYAKALKDVAAVVRVKTKVADALEHRFEKDVAKLVAAVTPKKAAKAGKIAAKRGAAKKVSKKTVRGTGKTMKRAAAAKKMHIAPSS